MLRLVLSDVHFPFQDDDLLKVWMKHLRALRPNGVDIIGDVIDCYTLSRFDKNPARKGNIQKEVDQASKFLGKLRDACPKNCDIRYSEGNHEARLRKTLWGGSKELAPLRNLNIPALMGLKDLGIKYYPPERPYYIGGRKGLWYIHGDVARKCNWAVTCGGMGAKAVCKAKQVNVIMGHTHQMGQVAFTGWSGMIEGYEVGCLCRFDLEYITGVPPWQQGWAVVKFPKQGGYEVSFVRVLHQKGKRLVIADGKVLATLPPVRSHI